MLEGHMDSTFLHTFAKTHPIATSTSYIIAKYVPETNMLTKLDI